VLLDLRSREERAALSVAVTQAAASLSATFREDFVLSAAVSQAAATVAATARERFILSATVGQPAASVSVAMREVFASTASVSQAAASLAPVLREDFRLATATTQAAAAISATLAAAVDHPSLGIVVSQAPATVSGSLVAPVSAGSPRHGRPLMQMRPVAPVVVPPPALELVARVSQPPARLHADLTYDDSELAVLLLAA
jgi:hypothetical protein